MRLVYHRGRNGIHERNAGKNVAKHAVGGNGEPVCGAGNGGFRYGWIQIDGDKITCPRCLNTKLFQQAYPPKVLSQIREEVASDGWVYLIKSSYGNLYKIGYGKNPKKRLAEIQSCSPVSLQLVHSIYFFNAAAAEKLLHETFREYRQHGEWFNLPDSAVEWICSWGGRKDA
jgi:hypothetical protein